jgi:hypothetical protein
MNTPMFSLFVLSNIIPPVFGDGEFYGKRIEIAVSTVVV